jgi:hypothetical protein
MAEPDNRNLKQPPTHVNDLGDQGAVESASRGGWRWWWVWPVIIAVAFWWAGWGWGSTGGWWWGRAHQQNTAIPAPAGSRTTETLANAGAKQPLTSAGADAGGARAGMTGPGVQVLAASDKRRFIGKQFTADDVPVQSKLNNHELWIGENNDMLAIVNGPGNDNARDVGPGNVVNAHGMVKRAPSASVAKREWALSDQDAARLEHEGAYIQVSEVTVPH